MSATAIPSKPTQRDPYKVLGLEHDATPSQIKGTYRKLALKYHPDRQTRRQSEGNATSDDATEKFVEIAAAYALLSDPVRKREYDHLYKFGAFDASNGESDEAHHNNPGAKCMNYQYTEDYSGGYYTSAKEAKKGSSAAARQSQFFRSQSTASQDSFFDDLIYSPKSRGNNSFFDTAAAGATSPRAAFSNPGDASCPLGSSSNNRFDGVKRKPGIGFAFPPLGKHLSIHIPSRNEIVMSMAKGERLHNFGTRVTFSSQRVESDGAEGVRMCSAVDNALNCTNQSVRCSKKFVSTTTRIAKGQHRVVKRTAYLHPDGKKEVVVEENGVVRQRYVEDFSKDASGPSTPLRAKPAGHPSEEDNKRDQVDEMPMNPSSSVQEEKENDRPWYSDIIRGMQCVIRPCFAPCGPVLATVPEQDS